MPRILIIEDDASIRENLSEILALNDYEVIAAENGKIGVQKALQGNIDLIICDVRMPELDGFGVLQLLGNHPRTANTPFLFLTALAEKDDFRQGMSLGADDYITKPFDITLLLQNVERRLKKTERLRSAAEPANGFGSTCDTSKVLTLLQAASPEQELRHYTRKSLLFEEGSHPRYLYYLEKGFIKLYKTNEEGRELIIRIAGPGEFLGYLPLLKNDRYSQSATVLEAADIRLFSTKDFQQLLLQNREANRLFMDLLADRVAKQEQMLIDLAYHSVRKRTADALAGLYDHQQTGIHFQRDDMAAIVGTAKETLIRTLADFKTEGLIEIRNRRIKMLNPEKLRRMPN